MKIECDITAVPVVLTLSAEEAGKLLRIVGNVGGESQNPISRFADELYRGLKSTGVMPSNNEWIRKTALTFKESSNEG